METLEEFLAHHGIKGMHWGVRTGGAKGPTGVTVTHKPGRKVKTKGGKRQPAHEDALRTAIIRQQTKKSTTDSISNKDLKELVDRMNLEQQYSRLASHKGGSSKFVNELVNDVGKQSAKRAANDALAKRIAKTMAKGAVAGAL